MWYFPLSCGCTGSCATPPRWNSFLPRLYWPHAAFCTSSCFSPSSFSVLLLWDDMWYISVCMCNVSVQIYTTCIQIYICTPPPSAPPLASLLFSSHYCCYGTICGIYLYIYHVHAYVYTCIIYVYVYIYVCTYIHMHIFVCVCVRWCVYTYVYIHRC